MGTFGKSLTRELGKNTGKWVSNKVFGTGHSTPHKLIHTREKEKVRKERDDARRYKEHQRELERDRKERDRQIRQREKEIAELDKQALIRDNLQEIKEHNNYIEVIQSVHKDYSQAVVWDEIQKLPDPEYIETADELKDYYQKYTNQQVDQKIEEARKTYRLSPFKYILGKYYKARNEKIFKFAGTEEFFNLARAISIFILVGGVSYFVIGYQEGNVKIEFILLALFGLSLLILTLLLYYGAKDYNKNKILEEALNELESNRSLWYEEYLKEQEAAHEKYREEKKETESLRKIAKSVIRKDQRSYIYAIKLMQPFEDLQEYGSDLSYEIVDKDLVVNFYPQSESVIPDKIKKPLKKGLEIKEEPIPTSRFNEIYQDYVCSCILRIAKEVFQLLPTQQVFINAKGMVLNSSTGNLEESTLVSIKIDREKLESLNFDLLDPSDSMKNFEHKMSFKKNEGFKPTSELV